MEFSVSGVTVSPFIPPLVAFVISFFTSMGGVSGAFLLLPFQMSVLGYTTPSVSATNQLFNIVAIPSGVWRYIREGRMVWPLTLVVVVATLPGVFIGAVIRIRYLPDSAAFKVFAGAVLLYIGIRMARDLFGAAKNNGGQAVAEERFQRLIAEYRVRTDEAESPLPSVKLRHASLSRISYEFYGEVFDFPTWGITALSFVVGVIGGVYGIGGGAIIAPFFVAVFGLPVYTVAGAALMGTFVTSVAAVAFFQAIAPMHPDLAVAPDWALGLLFGLGGAAGMYCGARVQKYVPGRFIKLLLCAIILFTAGKYVVGYFL